MTVKIRTLLTLSVLLGVLGIGVSSASAAEPWWHLNSGSEPANIAPGGEGKIVVTATNLGDADANGGLSFEDPAGSGVFGTPIKIVDQSPSASERYRRYRSPNR